MCSVLSRLQYHRDGLILAVCHGRVQAREGRPGKVPRPQHPAHSTPHQQTRPLARQGVFRMSDSWFMDTSYRKYLKDSVHFFFQRNLKFLLAINLQYRCCEGVVWCTWPQCSPRLLTLTHHKLKEPVDTQIFKKSDFLFL